MEDPPKKQVKIDVVIENEDGSGTGTPPTSPTKKEAPEVPQGITNETAISIIVGELSELLKTREEFFTSI